MHTDHRLNNLGNLLLGIFQEIGEAAGSFDHPHQGTGKKQFR